MQKFEETPDTGKQEARAENNWFYSFKLPTLMLLQI